MNFPKPSPLIDSVLHLQHTPKAPSPAFAAHDLTCCLDFLGQYANNKATFESYRREIERILQWSWLIEKKSLLDLKRQDMETYLQFCLNPPPSWIGLKKVSRFITHDERRIPNPQWRPFVVTVSKHAHKNGVKPNKDDYQLSQKAIREIFTVLSSFYNHLILEEKVQSNPIALIKQKNKYIQQCQHQKQVMRLSEKQWQTCLACVNDMARAAPQQHERSLFIISALYLLYLRISELCVSERWAPAMGHFYQDNQQHWWFKTVGKGNKMRDIAVPNDMLNALMRYRLSMQFTALPCLNDPTPLLPKDRGHGGISSSRHIRRIVQTCFDATIQHLRATGFTQDADSFEAATVHWLRHTGISDDINMRHRPIAHVRDDAGHSSSAITDRYNDIDLIERHQSALHKKLKSTRLDDLID